MPEQATAPVALCPGRQESRVYQIFYVLIVLILTKNYNNGTWQMPFLHNLPPLPAIHTCCPRFAPAARNSPPAPWMPLSHDSPPWPEQFPAPLALSYSSIGRDEPGTHRFAVCSTLPPSLPADEGYSLMTSWSYKRDLITERPLNFLIYFRIAQLYKESQAKDDCAS